VKRSNLLVDHVLDTPRPSPGDVWRSRKGTRSIRIVAVAVDAHSVDAESTETGRKSRLQLDTLVSTYVKVTEGTTP